MLFEEKGEGKPKRAIILAVNASCTP